MSNKLPVSVRGLSLSREEIFGWRRNLNNAGQSSSPSPLEQSILHPLRKQKVTRDITGEIVDTGKVCTAEAVVSALLALSILTNDEAALLIGVAERKVKETAAYQGSVRLLTEDEL